VDIGPYFAILPSDGSTFSAYERAGIVLHSVPQGFAYNSGSNPDFLTVEELRSLIKTHVDPKFQPL
jgi:hypothetical protein